MPTESQIETVRPYEYFSDDTIKVVLNQIDAHRPLGSTQGDYPAGLFTAIRNELLRELGQR